MVSTTLVDDQRQWQAASYGALARETGLEGTTCPIAVHADEVFVVEDTARDPRYPSATDREVLHDLGRWFEQELGRGIRLPRFAQLLGPRPRPRCARRRSDVG